MSLAFRDNNLPELDIWYRPNLVQRLMCWSRLTIPFTATDFLLEEKLKKSVVGIRVIKLLSDNKLTNRSDWGELGAELLHLGMATQPVLKCGNAVVLIYG